MSFVAYCTIIGTLAVIFWTKAIKLRKEAKLFEQLEKAIIESRRLHENQ